jgi:hypothetical protein
MNREIKYPGYTSDEIIEFCGESLQSIQREGIGACGSFLKTSSGKTHLLSKGDLIIKNKKGEISVKDIYGKIV